MESAQPVVMHETDAAGEEWDDPVKGRISFRTLFSAGTTPTAELTTGVATLEQGGWLGVHRHEPAEVYHVLEGEGVVILDGVEHPIRAGCAVFVPADVEHEVRNTGSARLRFFYAFAREAFDQVEYRFGSQA